MVMPKQELKEKILAEYQSCNQNCCDKLGVLFQIKKDLETYNHFYVPRGLKRWKTGTQLVETLSVQLLGENIMNTIKEIQWEMNSVLIGQDGERL